MLIFAATPTCSDGAKNQNETDVDCGGICGANCADTKTCATKADCLNDFCFENRCGKSTCSLKIDTCSFFFYSHTNM